MKLITFLFFILILNNPIQNKTNPIACEFNGKGLTNVEFKIALDKYLNCLIDEVIKTKTKSELINNLTGRGIYGKAINSHKIYSNHYISYQALLRLSNNTGLQKMMNSTNPELRYYGFLGIAEKQESNVFHELKKMIQDTSIVRTKFGCLSGPKTIADCCIKQVTKTYLFEDENFQSEIYQLNLQEKHELDSIILSTNNNLEYRKTLLQKISLNINK